MGNNSNTAEDQLDMSKRKSEEEPGVRSERKTTPPKDGMKRVKITDPIEARVEMIDGMFQLTQPVLGDDGKTVVQDGTLQKMSKIRAAISQAAREVVKAIRDAENEGMPKADTGRVIAGIDSLQAAKNIFCDALILAHAHKDVKDE